MSARIIGHIGAILHCAHTIPHALVAFPSVLFWLKRIAATFSATFRAAGMPGDFHRWGRRDISAVGAV
jgi:hypothetical protein